MDPECSMDPTHYKTSQKAVQFLIEHQLCFQMPKSSLFRRSTDDPLSNKQQTTTSTTATPTDMPPLPPLTTTPTPSKSSDVNSSTPAYIITQSDKPNSLFAYSNPSSAMHPSVSSSTKHSPASAYPRDDHSSSLHRSKTLPVKRSKYGGNDPLQVVQFNKPMIDSTWLHYYYFSLSPPFFLHIVFILCLIPYILYPFFYLSLCHSPSSSLCFCLDDTIILNKTYVFYTTCIPSIYLDYGLEH